MSEECYWFLAPADDDFMRRVEEEGPELEEVVISVPGWPEVARWVLDEGGQYVAAPMLFTSREAAESELRDLENREPEAYLSLVEEYGADTVNTALDNSAPLRVLRIGREALADKLEDSDVHIVMVDGRLKLRQEFREELSGDA